VLPQAIAALRQDLSLHLNLSKSRVETMALIVIGMISARTVNLSHLASERPAGALIASTYRRLQRFFQHARLAQDWSAPLVARLLDLTGSWHLVLDRTQWQVGARDVNVLVLAAVTPHFRVPLIWTVIGGRGCSDTDQRITLMRRYLKLFHAATIRLLLADREFVGTEWIEFLHESGIPFAIRLRGDLRVTTEAGRDLMLEAHLGGRGRTRFLHGRLGAGRMDGPLLNFALKRLGSGELLAVARARQRSPPIGSAGPSNVCSATPRPAASTSRTPASPTRASSTCSWASQPSPSPGLPAPPSRSSGPGRHDAEAMAISPSPGSEPASTTCAVSCEPIP